MVRKERVGKFECLAQQCGGGLRQQMRIGGEREPERRAVVRSECGIEMHSERVRGNSKDRQIETSAVLH